jgi:hypothetical protein
VKDRKRDVYESMKDIVENMRYKEVKGIIQILYILSLEEW